MFTVWVVCHSQQTLPALDGLRGYTAAMPVLRAELKRLQADLDAWIRTLQEVRRAHPYMCFVPTCRLWLLWQAFRGETQNLDAFYTLLRSINVSIPLSEALCTGVAGTVEQDNEGRPLSEVVEAIAVRLDEIMTAYPTPQPRPVRSLSADDFRYTSVVHHQAVDTNLGGEEEHKGNPDPDPDVKRAVRSQVPRVSCGQVMVVATPHLQVSDYRVLCARCRPSCC